MTGAATIAMEGPSTTNEDMTHSQLNEEHSYHFFHNDNVGEHSSLVSFPAKHNIASASAPFARFKTYVFPSLPQDEEAVRRLLF